MRTRRYSELETLDSFEQRFQYLKLPGSVGAATFGFDRYINQQFYRSREWKDVRDFVIVRDYGCDLGVLGYEIHDKILVHHMNPIDVDDILQRDMSILEPEFLICTTHNTHNAIHYGNEDLLPETVVERRPGDTRLW